ncbi:DMT family transporter [Gulosibacter sediminis]|uniref:DMT family transporter n=1 Tax=Gulosibacter sediminis TaxID=1729695 RepID=UPI0024A84174|nr:DMT family transporter [Gulosibacter sediminis]
MQYLGIPLAILGAVLMSVSAMLQHRGVARADAAGNGDGGEGLGLRSFLRLLKSKTWLSGTLLLGVAVVCQLGALLFSPLVLVQPIGVISLVLTAVITAKQSGMPVGRRKALSITLCVAGVGGFVAVASSVAVDKEITEPQLIVVLIILAALVLLLGIAFAFVRRTKWRSLFYVVAGGVMYGFLVTLAKVVLARWQQGDYGWYFLACAAGVVISLLVGGYFVQTAYASSSADLVIAGLTVIDPLVAVTIGIVVLRETDGANLLVNILFVALGALAVIGVLLLQLTQSDDEVSAVRNHALGRGN